jgi:hypothetical protein
MVSCENPHHEQNPAFLKSYSTASKDAIYAIIDVEVEIYKELKVLLGE